MSSFNIANNQLNGMVPNTSSLRRFPKEDFSGNNLCGFPLRDCSSPGNPGGGSGEVWTIRRLNDKKLGAGVIVGIGLGAATFLFLLIIIFVFLLRGNSYKGTTVTSTKLSKGSVEITTEDSKQQPSDAVLIADTDKTKVMFFESNRYAFDLEDLLRASADVLGKGTVGTTYKAILEDGTVVAVKRLKDVRIGCKHFEEQIEMVGKFKHNNLVPLLAFYSSKGEKLLVYDYMEMGSLSVLLHGNKGAGRTSLDWDSRVRISLGAASGIAYLHDESAHKFTHGNIKSSNILLTKDLDGCISDYGLADFVSSSPIANSTVGYRAPEVTDVKRVTQKADVYSFGVLMLELLTGRSPSQSTSNDGGMNLPRWVQSVVREEWNSEVFDLDLIQYYNNGENMMQMLQLALACVEPSPDQRPTMREVVEMIEKVRKINDENVIEGSPWDDAAIGHANFV